MPRFVTNEQVLADVVGQTVPRRFAETVAANADRVALRRKDADGETWHEETWSEYAQIAGRVAAGLRALGVGPDDRVVLMLRNRPEFHAADIGVLLLGATPISIYQSSAPDQIEYLVNHSGAVAAIIEDRGYLARFLSVRAALPRLRHLVLVDAGPVDPGSDGAESDGVTTWAELLEHEPLALGDCLDNLTPDDLATVIYTSGTTGPPKGVMITQRNVCWSVRSMEYLYEAAGVDTSIGWRTVSYLPMAHIAERYCSHYAGISFAMEVTTCPDTSLVASYLGAVKPHFFFGVPRVWEKMSAGINALAGADPELKAKLDRAVDVGHELFELRRAGAVPSAELQAAFEETSPVRDLVKSLVGLDQTVLAGTGAAPIPLSVLRFFDGLAVPISEVYGLSENTGAMSWEVWEHSRFGTVGRALPGATISLAADGEVLLKGGNVFAGYLDDSVKTAETINADGWMHTGDIGILDADGYLKIVDRKKELIITAGGKNISPANLEAAIKAIPIVGQVAVIGEARPFISALLVLDTDAAPAWAAAHDLGPLSLAELAAHPTVIAEVQRGLDAVNERFSNVERVKKFTLLGEEWLPDSDLLTPTMKLKRRGVNARYAAEIDAMY